MGKPRIHLITTGGTIAGTSASATDTTDYRAGSLTAEQLLASVPALTDIAEIDVENLYSIDSKDMTPEHWLGLARATQTALERDDVDGVVITHGTDTLEESAFFLDLVLQSEKPVVFTCAMRPATALSSDGPMNLFGAVSVAAHPEAAGLGVLVVANDRIHAAREVTKAHTQAVDAFISADAGPIGWARPPRIDMRPNRDANPPYPLAEIGQLPDVEVLVISAGSSPRLLEAVRANGAVGAVLAAPGNGSLPANFLPAVAGARAAGLRVVVTSRCLAGGLDGMHRERLPSPTRLSALKARVALIAACGSGMDEHSFAD